MYRPTPQTFLIAEFRSSFSVDGKASLEGQILKFVIFIDCIPDIPVKLSTIRYKDVDYIYGKVGITPNYFVMDMNGEMVSHEGNTYQSVHMDGAKKPLR